MAQKPAVHVEFRGEGWAVIREGNKRATSTHPTQSGAAESGRELARRDKSEFFLHARNGQIREHRDYREGQPSADEGIVDTVSETGGTVTDVVGGTTGVVAQAAGGAGQETETTANREEDQDHSVADSASGGERSRRGVEEEVSGLTGAERAEPLGTPEERYARYGVYDQYGERIGPLSDVCACTTGSMLRRGLVGMFPTLAQPSRRGQVVPTRRQIYPAMTKTTSEG